MKLKLTLLAAVLALAGVARAADNPVVVIETSKGTIEVELFADKAPKTVENFLAYTDDKFYDGTIFHRVIKDFMIQGGGMEPGLKPKKTKDQIKNESDNGLKNDRGTVAMARTDKPDTATSQFFVNVQDNNFLNKGDKDAVSPDGYCVFGKVTAGMDVVDKIRAVETKKITENGRVVTRDVPVEDVVIKSVTRKKK